METAIIGYAASSASILGFGSQFYHTLRTGSTEGISLSRTFLDATGLALWVIYSTRGEDIPLLIACSLELFTSLCLVIVVCWSRRAGYRKLKALTPPPSPPSETTPIRIEVVSVASSNL